MEKEVTDRISDQRLRNRIMEVVSILTEGDDAVREVGVSNYFEFVYDYIRYGGYIPPNSAITAKEHDRLMEVSRLLDEASDATRRVMTGDEFIATGWPTRIRSVAQAAMTVMLKRGWFSNNVEQEEPTTGDRRPY